MFSKLRLECSLVTVILVAATALGQVTTGTPPFGSFGGGPFDTVNLGNLNVHFSIPVVQKAGRGIPFTYALSYDSSVWTEVTNNGITSWSPTANWGWKGDTEIATGYVSNNQSNFLCDPRLGKYKTTVSGFVYHDPFGTSHAISGDAWIDECQNTIHNLVGRALDGSGYTVYFYVDGSGTAQVTSRTGSVINPPFNVTSGAGKATDANGNQITTDGSGKFYDTLSGTAQVLTVAGTSPKTFTYTSPSGSKAYSLNYTAKNVWTSFGCSGIGEYQATNVLLVSSIGLPDGSQYAFTYETSGTHSGYVTGRLASVQLRTGGTISYAYTGANGGINCTDGSTLGLNRTTPDSSTPWTYSRLGSGLAWTTTVTDPLTNATVINFEKDSSTTGPTNNFYETQRLVKQGSNALSTTITCYNGVNVGAPSSCYNTAVASPISRTTAFHDLPTSSGSQAETDTTYNTDGLVTEVDEYDYGTGAVGPLIRKTIIGYAALGNGIVGRPSSVTIEDAGNHVQAFTSYGYDETTPTATTGTPQHISITGSRGNLTTVTTSTSSTASLSKTFTYYDSGTPNMATDVNGSQTAYVYGTAAQGNSTVSCGNAFPTTINEPLSLSRSIVWNCTGGVATQMTDENGKTITNSYTDPNFWRPASTTDQLQNATTFDYSPTAVDSSQVFNGGNSLTETGIGFDGLGRPIVTNHRQAPGSSTWDTYPQSYDANGRLSQVYMPCATGAWTCPTPYRSISYDALNRARVIADGGGGTVTYCPGGDPGCPSSGQDVLVTIGPAPAGENAKQKQYEHDGLGRLTSVCEILASGGTDCGQHAAASGYKTSYAYSVPAAGGSQKVVTQGTQTRTYVYDELGRLLSETNPETNNIATTYKYDTDAACNLSALGLSSPSKGDLISMTDANGNKTCYTYDSLHRVTDIVVLKNNACYPPVKRLRYDNTSGKVLPFPTGYSATNASGRMVEAWTGDCVWPTPSSGSDSATDEWFAYSARGEMTDLWESTAHIAGYYHGTASYAANGALISLGGVPGYTTITYGLDGEGRPNTATQGTTSLITGVTYTAASQPWTVSLGAGDSDNYGYDPNTGRMSNWTFTVGSTPKSQTGTLTWNPNGTLQKLVIGDGFNAGGAQTCKFGDPSASVAGYDDLERLVRADCGSAWLQTFSYDQYANIGKSGSSSWMPGYDPATNHALPPITYDNNGNLTNDTFHTYGWYVDNKLGSTDSTTCGIFGSTNGTCILYDAFGREVERGVNGVYTEVMYTPVGKTAIMNGEFTTLNAYFPLPGGATYNQNGSTNGTGYFWHKDWLGSVCLSSSVLNRTSYFDRAFAPYGEMYNNFGNTGGLNFTGDTQDSFAGLFDTPNRELHPGEGRWLSPDPAGLAAVDPSNPQTWNRYAYVGNNPVSFTDPTGLKLCDGCHFLGGGGGGNCTLDGVDTPCGIADFVATTGAAATINIPSGTVTSSFPILGPTSPFILTPGGGLCELHGWQDESTWYECSGGISAGDPTLVGGPAANKGPTNSTGCSVGLSCGSTTTQTHRSTHCTITVGQNGNYTAYDGAPSGNTLNSQLIVKNSTGGPPGPNTFYLTDSCSVASCIPTAAQNVNNGDYWYSVLFQNSNNAFDMMTSQCGINVPAIPTWGP